MDGYEGNRQLIDVPSQPNFYVPGTLYMVARTDFTGDFNYATADGNLVQGTYAAKFVDKEWAYTFYAVNIIPNKDIQKLVRPNPAPITMKPLETTPDLSRSLMGPNLPPSDPRGTLTNPQKMLPVPVDPKEFAPKPPSQTATSLLDARMQELLQSISPAQTLGNKMHQLANGASLLPGSHKMNLLTKKATNIEPGYQQELEIPDGVKIRPMGFSFGATGFKPKITGYGVSFTIPLR